jgi:hypothetical protein
MLQQALNRHPQIVIPPETKYFFSFMGHTRTCQFHHLRRLREDLGIELPVPVQAISSPADARSYYALLADRYIRRVGKPDVAYFGEKTPEHTGVVPRIRSVISNAKFLLIYRDGRDVALSLTKVPWMHDDIYVNFAVWLYYVHHQIRLEQTRNLDLLCVKYENLVTDPIREFKTIMNFLELRYLPNIVDGYGNREGVPERELGWKARALEKITSQRIGLWRTELPVKEIGVLERLGGSTLRSLGYDLMLKPQPIPLTFFPRFAAKALSMFTKLPFHLVANQFLGKAWCFSPPINHIEDSTHEMGNEFNDRPTAGAAICGFHAPALAKSQIA